MREPQKKRRENVCPETVHIFRCQELVVSGFSKLLGSQKDENWPLPTMYAVCLDLRLLALKADHQKSKGGKGKPGETLEKASEGIMSCFRWEQMHFLRTNKIEIHFLLY